MAVILNARVSAFASAYFDGLARHYSTAFAFIMFILLLVLGNLHVSPITCIIVAEILTFLALVRAFANVERSPCFSLYRDILDSRFCSIWRLFHQGLLP